MPEERSQFLKLTIDKGGNIMVNVDQIIYLSETSMGCLMHLQGKIEPILIKETLLEVSSMLPSVVSLNEIS